MNEIYLSLKSMGPVLVDVLMWVAITILAFIARRQSLQIKVLEAFDDLSFTIMSDAQKTINKNADDCNGNFEGVNNKLDKVAKVINSTIDIQNKNSKAANDSYKMFAKELESINMKMIPAPLHGPDGKFVAKPKKNPNAGKYECMIELFGDFTKGKFYEKYEAANLAAGHSTFIGNNRQRHTFKAHIAKKLFRLVEK